MAEKQETSESVDTTALEQYNDTRFTSPAPQTDIITLQHTGITGNYHNKRLVICYTRLVVITIYW